MKSELKSRIEALRSLKAAHQVAQDNIDEQINVLESAEAVLERPLPPDPGVPVGIGPVGSAVPAAKSSGGVRKAGKGRAAKPHAAVTALTAEQLKPYRGSKDFVALGLRYAELHSGVVKMAELVPLAVKLGVTKADYKNAWGNIHRRFTTHPRFKKSDKGQFTVTDLVPVDKVVEDE